jgi:hypothetical protein
MRGIPDPELTMLKLTLLSVIVPSATQRPPPLARRTLAEPEFTVLLMCRVIGH